MNYERIYSEFIADRLTKQPVKPEYFEKHHIVPRSLGGGNEQSNLIRLTPEDHFFAHLLLAKTHGGKMWAPIAFMVGGSRKDWKPTASRKSHGWSVRALSKSLLGEGSPKFDTKRHTFINAAGVEWSGFQSEMPKALGLSKSMANMLIRGRVSVAKGWSVVGEFRKTLVGEAHHMFRPKIHDFVHVDGRTFRGTQLEFSKVDGMHRPAASKLVSGASRVWKGWYMKGSVLPTMGRGAKWQQGLKK